MSTKKLFAAPIDQHAPIETPSGPKQGVKAVVYTYPDGDCESEPRIAWLEMYTPKVKALLLEQKDRDRDGVAVAGYGLKRPGPNRRNRNAAVVAANRIGPFAKHLRDKAHIGWRGVNIPSLCPLAVTCPFTVHSLNERGYGDGAFKTNR